MDLPIDVTYDEIGMVSQQRHYQTRSTSVGDMLQGYQLTVMDDAFQAKLDRRIADAVVDRRLAATGLASGSVLVVVSLLVRCVSFRGTQGPRSTLSLIPLALTAILEVVQWSSDGRRPRAGCGTAVGSP